jgi:spore germination protein KB
MNIEKGKISGSQLLLSITASIQGAIYLLSYTANITKHDTWLAVLSGCLLFAPVALTYALLSKRFAGNNLVQIAKVVLGPYWGSAIALLYFQSLLMGLAFHFRYLAIFTLYSMPETPLVFILVIFTAVCAYAVTKGLEGLARLSFSFVAVSSFLIIISSLLLLENMHTSNFLPLLEISFKDFIHGVHIIALIPIGTIFSFFLMIMPYQNDSRQTVKNTLLGLLLGSLNFLVVAVRNTAVLGNSESMYAHPSLAATRLIDIGNLLTRMDILLIISQILLSFYLCSLIYYATVLSLSQLLCLRTYTPLIIPIGGIAVTLSIITADSLVDLTDVAQNSALMFFSPIIFVVPPLLLLIAKLRGLPDSKSESGKLT